jgi:hypothetical protein
MRSMGPWISALAFVVASGSACAQALRTQHALGVQRVLVLAVSFPDVPAAPPPLARIKQRMLYEAAEYYATQSYGKIRLEGG